MTVKFGGKQTEVEIEQFTTVGEAITHIPDEELLKLINYAHRLMQLNNIRRKLEHHPRGTGGYNGKK